MDGIGLRNLKEQYKKKVLLKMIQYTIECQK